MNSKIVAIAAIFFFASLTNASTENHNPKIERVAIEGEYILTFQGDLPMENIFQLSRQFPSSFLPLSSRLQSGDLQFVLNRKVQGLRGTEFRATLFVDAKAMAPELWQNLKQQAIQVQPNYRYLGDLREDTDIEPKPAPEPEPEMPNDPDFDKQVYHNVLQSVEAWSLLGDVESPIIVAVTDDGVDYEHEDLKDNIYQNPNEIPDNDIDDDGNGYVDDVYGWDFSSGDNDSRPNQSYYSHGTHVAGIVAGTLNNELGIAGVGAPAAQIMPLQFAGGGGGFTSKVIAETYKYAADNGAHIVTTSYNIDSFVNDDLFKEAIAYVYDKGLIHFNSAGNANTSGPRRQIYQEILLVCSTIADDQNNDKKSSFSNYGAGIDLCAPGGGGAMGIYSTIPGNKYGEKSGTSMAAPNAAGVAALIWAKNPSWTRDQVVAQLLGTSQNIDEPNPGNEGLFGAGRVNPMLALSDELPLAEVQSIGELKSNDQKDNEYSVTLTFTQVLDPKTITVDAFAVYAGETQVPVMSISEYKMASNSLTLTFEHDAPADRIVIKDTILNPFGEAIDGDGDGVAGGEGQMTL